MKAILDTKPKSGYHDDLSKHYHFPRRYMSVLERCVGDWVVLRRPRADGGNLAYFAAAKVVSIEPDPQTVGMSYARFSDFLSFDEPAPWLLDGRYMEEALRNLPRQEVGIHLRGRSVRPLADQDFADLIRRGLGQSLDAQMARRVGLAPDNQVNQ